MSGKSGSVVPGFTRTCAPGANRAGVRAFFSCVAWLAFFLLMVAPPLSLPVILHTDGPGRQALCWDSPREGQGYNDPMKILFLRGWQSVPGGVKPTFLARHGLAGPARRQRRRQPADRPQPLLDAEAGAWDVVDLPGVVPLRRPTRHADAVDDPA